jgi:hypothetical protein
VTYELAVESLLKQVRTEINQPEYLGGAADPAHPGSDASLAFECSSDFEQQVAHREPMR